MIVKMKFLSITGPRADIDRILIPECGLPAWTVS